MPADHAINAVAEVFGKDRARHFLLEHLKAALLIAVAGTASIDRFEADPDIQKIQPIPPELWDELQSFDLWETGYAAFSMSHANPIGHKRLMVRCFDIRFDPHEVRKLLSERSKKPPERPSTAPPEVSVSASHKGGRPRKDYWDALWVEICRQIYVGALIPKKQSDIEKAMLDWAAKHGHELSEQAARPRARALKAALEKDKN